MKTLSARTGWFHTVAAGIALLLAVFGQGLIPAVAAHAADHPTTVTVKSTDAGTATLDIQGDGYTNLPNASTGKAAMGVYAAVIDHSEALSDITETSGALAEAWVMPQQISNGTFDTSLAVSPGALTAGHSYDVLVWVAHGFANDQTVLSRVPVPFTQDQLDSLTTRITTQPKDASVHLGDNATFTVAAAGTPQPSVQWQSKSGDGAWNNIAGATEASYTVTKATQAQNGTQYRAALTKWGATTESSAATLTVLSAPAAPSAPTATVTASDEVTVHWTAPNNGGSAITGYTVTLTPQSGGTPLTAEVSGSTLQKTFSAINAARGAAYTATVVAHNAIGDSPASAASAAVEPRPIGAPSAPAAPRISVSQGLVNVDWSAAADDGGSAITGYTVTLTASTGAVQTKTYAGSDGNIVNVGTDTPYEIQFPVQDSAASYTAVVQAVNAKGTSDASAASPAATLPTTAVSVSSADTSSMTVHISGTGYLNLPDGYVSDGSDGSDPIHLGNSGVYAVVLQPGVDPAKVTPDTGFLGDAAFISTEQITKGAFTQDIQIPVSSLTRGETYTVLVWAAHGLALPGSILAQETIPITDAQWNDMLPVPDVTSQPADTHVVAGSDATFTASAKSAAEYGTLKVQWQSKSPSGDWTDIAKATTNTLTVPEVTPAQSGTQYRAVFTNANGPSQTKAATLSVDTVPTVSDPASTTVAAGQDATFSVSVSGAPQPEVQWQQSTSESDEWTDVSGATQSTLTVSKVTAAQTGTQYRAVVTNRAGTATSGTAVLTVVSAPAEDDLTAKTQSGVEVTSTDGTDTVTFAPGQQQASVTLRLTGAAAQNAGGAVWAYLESDPVLLTTTPATLTNGSTQITIQRSAVTAGAHKVAVLGKTGELLGWAPVTIVLQEAPAPSPNHGAGSGSTTGQPTSVSARGSLPRTGESGLLAVAGGALLLLGAALVSTLAFRRRRADR